jgi:hypothetical protein
VIGSGSGAFFAVCGELGLNIVEADVNAVESFVRLCSECANPLVNMARDSAEEIEHLPVHVLGESRLLTGQLSVEASGPFCERFGENLLELVFGHNCYRYALYRRKRSTGMGAGSRRPAATTLPVTSIQG